MFIIVLYMRRLRVFFYFSCAGRIVTCYDDDDQISCGCICDLKIFAVFIELGTQGKFVFRAADIFAVCALHCVSSCNYVCSLLQGWNFERWMIGKNQK